MTYWSNATIGRMHTPINGVDAIYIFMDMQHIKNFQFKGAMIMARMKHFHNALERSMKENQLFAQKDCLQ